MDHDRNLRIGKVVMLYRDRGWICCEFALDRDVPEDIEFEVGQPVSVGLSELKIGSRGTYLREVSVVRRGAVEGAQITRRWEIKETPPPPPTRRTPAPTPKPAHAAAGKVFYGDGTIIRRNVGKVISVTDEYGHTLVFE